jgi:hypothetical protein
VRGDGTGRDGPRLLGRDRYERREKAEAPKEGSRNGYSPFTIKTTSGPVTLQRPKLRASTAAFASRLLGRGVTRTNAIESLVIAGWVRGLSTRDIEATLEEALGAAAKVSKSTVSRICEAIKVEFDAFKVRDLSGVELEYLFLDGSHFKMHPGAGARRLGNDDRRQAGPALCRAGGDRVHRRLAGLLAGDGRPRAAGAGARHLRRRSWAHLWRRARLRPLGPSALRSSGRCWTGRAVAGEASRCHRRSSASSNSCATSCWSRPQMKLILQPPPWSMPLSRPPPSITTGTYAQRLLHQPWDATPLLPCALWRLVARR